MAKHGKRMKKAIDGIDREADYALGVAVKMVKERATTKFDETVEMSINLNVDPRHADQMVRGVTSLPHGTGKSVRVAVFAKGDKVKEAEDAGADLVGGDDSAQKIQAGDIDFDRCVRLGRGTVVSRHWRHDAVDAQRVVVDKRLIARFDEDVQGIAGTDISR